METSNKKKWGFLYLASARNSKGELIYKDIMTVIRYYRLSWKELKHWAPLALKLRDDSKKNTNTAK